MADTSTLRRIGELYQDAQRCAEVAGLTYVRDDEPGIRRRRQGRGFSYRDETDRALRDAAVKQRIVALAVPPAWKNVWICPDDAGHILATGEDEKGRKQYIYHENWRTLRDLLNSYRLIEFAEVLPTIRAHVVTQLRRRTVDRDQVLAAMVRIIDTSAVRIGNEVYAEENDSFGLSTLSPRHVRVHGPVVELDFPAKSNKRAELVIRDRAVARVVGVLAAQRRRRLFTVDGDPIDAADVNALLMDLTGQHVTAKDFRTWRGTVTAFGYLRQQLTSERDPDKVVLEAVDAAAEALGNTRTVARAHYVHPHVVQSFAERTFAADLRASKPGQNALFTEDERRLVGLLDVLLERSFG